MGQCCALDFMMTAWALLMPKVLAASLKPMPATQALFTASHVAGLEMAIGIEIEIEIEVGSPFRD